MTTVLQWAMTELMRNPTVMSKAQDEVREVFKWKKMVSNDDINKLTYLQFVIKETVRLHTPGPLFMRECQEQCQVMGYDVPKGTKFLLNLWSISRDPKYWDDPETFKPERSRMMQEISKEMTLNSFHLVLGEGCALVCCLGSPILSWLLQTFYFILTGVFPTEFYPVNWT